MKDLDAKEASGLEGDYPRRESMCQGGKLRLGLSAVSLRVERGSRPVKDFRGDKQQGESQGHKG